MTEAELCEILNRESPAIGKTNPIQLCQEQLMIPPKPVSQLVGQYLQKVKTGELEFGFALFTTFVLGVKVGEHKHENERKILLPYEVREG